MASIRPRDPSGFYRLVGRWCYAQHKLPGSAPTAPPWGRDAEGWLVNAPQSLVDFLKENGCALDERPD